MRHLSNTRIQYSLDRLTASAQTFANHFLDSSLVKGIVDFGNTTINVIDKVTSALTPLGTLALGGGIFASFKNVGKRRSTMFHNCFEYAPYDGDIYINARSV